MAATVSASSGAPAGPSTLPQATPLGVVDEPGWTKRAIRTIAKATGHRRRSRSGKDDAAATQPHPSRIIGRVTSPLSGLPVDGRRRLAATLGLFAALFVAVGLVATTGSTPGVVRVFSAVALIVAAVLALTAWGVARSVKIDVREQRHDKAIERAIAARGGATPCGCGHDHDMDELHVSDDQCAHDGAGTDCTRSCESCVLATLRPLPTRSRAERLAQQSVTDGVVQREP
jgi:hypothetical protein